MSGKDRELLGKMRSEAVELFNAAVKRVDPYEAVRNFVRLRQGTLILGHGDQAEVELELDSFDRIFVVGGGKATAPMARAIEDLMGKRIDCGVINVKYGFKEELSFTEIIEASHPLPDKRGVEGTAQIMELLEKAGENDLVFSLISGGGSALMPYPANGISLEEKQAVTRELLECGASIDEINAIRKHISQSKGGQMARAAFPATTVNLMLSDVVGDRMDVIASGPFVPDRSSFQDAWAVLRKYELKDIPASIRRYLQEGMEGKVPETPTQGDPIFEKVYNFIVGSNILALEAAKEAGERMGYQCLILSSMVEGETREVAKVHAAIAKEILKSGRPLNPPACIISGGETTVTIHGHGLGGRNQEFCLACALELEDLPARVVILSGGTDGNDGPTDAAGAMVDPLTVERGKSLGLDASSFLEENDSYHFFEKTRDLLITGPTRTNVMDVRLVLVR
ncbi:MAG: glycerate kinase [Deltaproteobacteria bacterium]|nr:glycerate kinase [Deltaproteobacteria bacterium]MBW1919330.1 glycerate kinase [Deltaproteobacteria bacterium]MBW1936408.1 glycerate kinase [Deltaproteobacteria bacterium]MBW2045171.1 glycerate kinase [Deltaproteobacteria bacterium]